MRQAAALPGILVCALIIFYATPARAQQEPGPTLDRARTLVRQAQWPEAEAELRGYLQSDPRSADAKFLLGYVLFRRDQPAESLRIYTAAAALERPTADDFKIVGLDYVLLQDYPDAIHWLERAVSEDPRNAEAAYHLGRAYYTQNRFDRAKAAFEQALRIDPHYGKAQNNLGLTWAALNRPDLAEEAYRKAIQIGDQTGTPSEQPFINLAGILLDHNQAAEALELLRKARRMQPRSSEIEALRGRALLLDNRLEDAEDAFRVALAIGPETGALHYQLGRVLRREGKSDEARREFDRTKALMGTHSAPPS